MSKKIKKFFHQLDLTKTVSNEDGSITVSGIASSESIDCDGEIILSSAMKAAIPGYMKFGAVREMHQASAVGTALDISVDDNGDTIFKAKIVDDDAIKKVKAGVYKGFSIGAIVKARDQLKKTIITDIELFEISLVDRPANPDAIISMYKNEKIEKGMYSIGWMSSLLCDLKYLLNNIEDEEEYEQDDSSTITKELSDVVSALASVLVKYTQEEVQELTQDITNNQTQDAVSDQTQDAVSDKTQSVSDQTQDNSITEDDDLNKTKIIENNNKNDLTKSLESDKITLSVKHDFEIEELKKSFKNEFEKLNKLVNDQAELIKSMKDLPVATKFETALIQKGQESLNIFDEKGNENKVASLIKSIHANKR